MAFPTSLQPLLQQICSVRGAVFIIGKICLVLAVGLAHGIGDNLRKSKLQHLPENTSTLSLEADSNQQKADIASYSIIAKRNIFGEKPKAVEEKPKNSEPKTSLKLRLVATNISSNSAPFAIVEETSKKKQDVFELEEKIFDQAKLVEILAESIKIEHRGSIEVLEMAAAKGGSSSGSGGISGNEEGTEFSVEEEELSKALANLPRLLSQARAVPYFRNGKSIGMRLFAIRRGSLYEKLGMKNGDIILSVNKSSVNDPAQALKIFEKLKTERNINLELERNGQASNLRYSIR